MEWNCYFCVLYYFSWENPAILFPFYIYSYTALFKNHVEKHENDLCGINENIFHLSDECVSLRGIVTLQKADVCWRNLCFTDSIPASIQAKCDACYNFPCSNGATCRTMPDRGKYYFSAEDDDDIGSMNSLTKNANFLARRVRVWVYSWLSWASLRTSYWCVLRTTLH